MLAVTAPALADEIAGAGDLAKGKLSMTPVAVVRGLGHLVLPPGEDGPGAATLVRDEGSDMFGLGTREAVLQALLGEPGRGFGVPAAAAELVPALTAVAAPGPAQVDATDGTPEVVVGPLPADPLERGRLQGRLEAAAYAHGWGPAPHQDTQRLKFRPLLP